MRAKEGLADYRYFPEPDLPPVTITDEYQADVQAAMQELPSQKRARYTQLGLSMQVSAAGSDALGRHRLAHVVATLWLLVCLLPVVTRSACCREACERMHPQRLG